MVLELMCLYLFSVWSISIRSIGEEEIIDRCLFDVFQNIT